jgi:hypothetical protein
LAVPTDRVALVAGEAGGGAGPFAAPGGYAAFAMKAWGELSKGSLLTKSSGQHTPNEGSQHPTPRATGAYELHNRVKRVGIHGDLLSGRAAANDGELRLLMSDPAGSIHPPASLST